jgi:hypothetical protein
MEYRMTGENKSKSVLTMSIQDYPGLFQGAIAASVSAQKTYFMLQRIYLGSLIMVGMIGMLTSLFTGCGLAWAYTSDKKKDDEKVDIVPYSLFPDWIILRIDCPWVLKEWI